MGKGPGGNQIMLKLAFVVAAVLSASALPAFAEEKMVVDMRKLILHHFRTRSRRPSKHIQAVLRQSVDGVRHWESATRRLVSGVRLLRPSPCVSSRTSRAR